MILSTFSFIPSPAVFKITPNAKRIIVRFNTFGTKSILGVPFDNIDLNDKQIEGPMIHVNLKRY